MKIRVTIRHIVMSDLPFKDKLQKMREILENDTVKNVLYAYPIETYTLSIRFLTKKMRSKRVLSIYYLMKIREQGRHKKGWGKFLRLFGIGK